MHMNIRNNTIEQKLGQSLQMLAPSFARRESDHLGRTSNPISSRWLELDNDTLVNLIKYQFPTIESVNRSSILSGYEEILTQIGDRITGSVLSWKKLNNFKPISDEVIKIQYVLKSLLLNPSEHANLIKRVEKCINNKCTDSKTRGSVLLLNNLHVAITKAVREAPKDNDGVSSFYDDVFEFL